MNRKKQVHIAGTVRSGKSTLAHNLKRRFEEMGCHAVVLDIDETRTTTFQEDEPPLGSALQKMMQAWAYNTVFGLRIPDVLAAGGISIFAATHAHPDTYRRAKKIADELGTEFKFIILETPGFEEMAERCQRDPKGFSDMRDPFNNPAERANYEDISSRIARVYEQDFSEPHIRISQGTPEEMTERALAYIIGE